MCAVRTSASLRFVMRLGTARSRETRQPGGAPPIVIATTRRTRRIPRRSTADSSLTLRVVPTSARIPDSPPGSSVPLRASMLVTGSPGAPWSQRAALSGLRAVASLRPVISPVSGVADVATIPAEQRERTLRQWCVGPRAACRDVQLIQTARGDARRARPRPSRPCPALRSHRPWHRRRRRSRLRRPHPPARRRRHRLRPR